MLVLFLGLELNSPETLIFRSIDSIQPSPVLLLHFFLFYEANRHYLLELCDDKTQAVISLKRNPHTLSCHSAVCSTLGPQLTIIPIMSRFVYITSEKQLKCQSKKKFLNLKMMSWDVFFCPKPTTMLRQGETANPLRTFNKRMNFFLLP